MNEHGRGGLGRVFRAYDRELLRDVALKELLEHHTVAEIRFFREALITARLEHPGIVPVHEAGRWPDGTPFYTMKLVAGRPLSSLIAECKSLRERLALLPNLIAVTDAMAYAHDQRIVHRDLKPSNIIIGDFGETVVIDWGLAKEMHRSRDDADPSSVCGPLGAPELTAMGAVVGTPAYMAPEQAAGGNVDERTDTYSLGAILHELCTGRPPNTVVDTPSDVPRDLWSIVSCALSRDPSARYQSVKDLGVDLRSFQKGLAVSTHVYALRERATRWIHRHRTVVNAVAVVTAMFAVALIWFAFQMRRERDSAREQRDIAERERNHAEQSSRERLVAKAEALLATDPTNALATLSELDDGPWPQSAYDVAADAVARGVADAIFPTQGSRIAGLAYVDDRRFVTLNQNGQLTVWRDDTGEQVLAIDDVDGHIGTLAVVDGRQILAGRASGALLVIDVASGKPTVAELDGHTSWLYDIATTADGSRAVTASNDRTVRVWDLRTNTCLIAIEAETPIARARFRDAETLVACGLDNILREWEVATGVERRLGECDVAGEIGVTLAASADGRWIAVPDARARMVLLDAHSRTRTHGRDHTAPISDVFVAGSQGIVASASLDGTVEYATLRDARVFATARHDGGAARVVITPTGYGISGGEDGVIRALDLDSGRQLELRGHASAVRGVATNRDGTAILTADRMGQVRKWTLPALRPRGYRAHTDRFVAADVVGNLIATAARGGAVILRRLGRETLDRFKIPEVGLTGISVNPIDQVVAISSTDGRVWLRRNDGSLHELRPRGAQVGAMSWSPDGNELYIGDASGELSAFDVASHDWRIVAKLDGPATALALDRQGVAAGTVTGNLYVLMHGILAERRGHEGKIQDVAFVSDRELVSTGIDGHMVRWTWRDNPPRLTSEVVCTGNAGRAVAAMAGLAIASFADGTVCSSYRGKVDVLRRAHVGEVMAVGIAHDGAFAVSGGHDGKLVYWRPGADEYASVYAHAGQIDTISVAGDGSIVTTGADGYVRIWSNISFDRLIVPSGQSAFLEWVAANRALTTERKIGHE